MSLTLRVRVDTREVAQIGERLDRLANQGMLREAAIDAVNATIEKWREQLIEGETRDINLSPAYVKSKTDTRLAVRDPRGEIITDGSLVRMAQYPLNQLTEAAPRAKGDAARGIPAGAKQAGLRVAIKRSAATEQPKWFLMRLRRGTAAGDKMGVFVRTGKDRKAVAHIYGPAPYSLFRHQVGANLERIGDDLLAAGGYELTRRMGDL